MRVIVTAGHVDHGKSTLVQALTGRNPDRLAEERRRGVTIELGYAWTSLPVAGDVAFVDVPGHERFVATMLAGAGPVTVALLVVAADEGWMPQSAEHLAILRLLDVRHAVVAITRADLVDEETAELAAALTAEELAGTALADAPVVRVSARSGAGLADLRAALDDVLGRAPAPPDRGRPRLWVDRAFTVKGAGTVVTGTLLGGSIGIDDVLVIPTSGVRGRVRGLQALERAVDRVQPGWRVAVNLAGVGVEAVPRGAALVHPGRWCATSHADLWCTPADGQVLSRRGAWKLHVGSTAVPVRLHPVSGTDLVEPGAVRADLSHPVVLAAGDRVVLRDAGPGGTGGGGVVLDPAPPPAPRGRDARARAVAQLTAMAGRVVGGTAADRLRAVVDRRQQVDVDQALAAADAVPADIRAAGCSDLGGLLVTDDRWRLLGDQAVRAVAGVHQRRPALDVVDWIDARGLVEAADAPAPLARAVLDRLVQEGRLDAAAGGVRVPGHRSRLTDRQQALAAALDARLQAAGVTGLAVEDVRGLLGDDDLLAALRRARAVVDLGDTVVGGDVLLSAVAALPRGPFTVAQARDALGASRRIVVPLLEATDRLGLTVRDGDVRRVAVGAPGED